ncbi:MAG: putative alpha-amylase family protein [Promethearchaeota archaeon]|nr:MAG: putative alpha-amylase family protein [Candidatus Lokiarchaeota archaeon]
MPEKIKSKNSSLKIYEINTLPWINELTRRYSKKIKLDNIPEEIFEEILYKFDAIWLMGVWERSPKSREIALNEPDLREGFNNVLPDLKDDDVVGSPYAVYYYHVDKYFGGFDALDKFREKLHEKDMNLILDFVPNHVAVDHLWTLEKSDVFLEGTKQDLENNPDMYFAVDDRVFAHGKDPYYPPWTDTVQINAFSNAAREKMVSTLNSIAQHCDGVRCDMAMLVTNEIFKKNWGEHVRKAPKKDFWEVIIPKVHEKYPEFLFIAEVYWDMEWKLMQQGFDFCYDKTLYDRLKSTNVDSIIGHLQADLSYQKKLLRFIENHDEERALKAFGKDKSMAAALISFTIPGAKLVYEGQMKGYETKIPVQLSRRPEEATKEELVRFYKKILDLSFEDESSWNLCEIKPVESEGDNSHEKIIAHQWENEKYITLISVNYSPFNNQAIVHPRNVPSNERELILRDVLSDSTIKRSPNEIKENGLTIGFGPWESTIFRIPKV